MTKSELVKKTKEIMNLRSDKAATEVVDGFTKVLMELISSGEEISLGGLGKFTPTVKAERKCRNPKTGEEVVVPEKKSFKFKPSTTIKRMMNESVNK